MKQARGEAQRFRQSLDSRYGNAEEGRIAAPLMRLYKPHRYSKDQLLLIRAGKGDQVPVPANPPREGDKPGGVMAGESPRDPPRPAASGEELSSTRHCPWPNELKVCLAMGFDRDFSIDVLETTSGALEASVSILADPTCSPEVTKEEARRLSHEMMGRQDTDKVGAGPPSPISIASMGKGKAGEGSPGSPPHVLVQKKVNQNKSKQKEARKGKGKGNEKKKPERTILDLTQPSGKAQKMPVDLFQMLVMLAVAFAVVVVVQL